MNCANHPERERIAFCQNCGKPLCQECTRTVGTAVFCEPCLAAKLAGNTPPPTGGSYTYTGTEGGLNYTVAGTIPPPPVPGEPNPGLAALLGFIPGVGAMYNGQYAKGLVHLIVFAVLVSLAHENGIFGLFIAGWVFYQVIEAHHTARARRDGTPLPNPFGLNDLGERLGFGKAWPNTASGAAPPSPEGTVPPASTYAPSQTGYPPFTAPASSWSTPSWENYVPPVPPVQPGSPYVTPLSPLDPNAPIPRNRFPAGAIWLIALGTLFLVGNAGLFHGFPIHRLIPFFLIGLGIWLFIHKMTATGATLADDGTPLYRMRLFRALRGSIWVILVGVLFFLASYDIVPWSRSWPLFIIVGGLMMVFERTAFSTATAPVYPYPPPPTPPTPPASTTSIVPSSTHDQEGS
jgi:hypothetical protein